MSCRTKKTELLWEKSLYQIGSQSSPRVVDLNGDGVKDIVMGAGQAEMSDVEQGIVALDGTDGALLWQAPATAHVVGSPTFLDVNGDEVLDVFIGGRGHFLVGLDGKSGEQLWSYEYHFENDSILKYARYNFYNSVLVPDQNGDDIDELLIVNGGNWNAAANSTEDRYPGVLMLLNPVDGSVIAADTMPDGNESYMSPICFHQRDQAEPIIVFGTGGETLGGSLFFCSLSSLLSQDLKSSTKLVSQATHGFIAPPAAVDINGDGNLDVVSVSHGGKITISDIANQQDLWQKTFEGYEVSSTPAIGQFNKDDVPDALFLLCKGVWPAYSISMQLVLDGKNGEVIYQDSVGCYALSSAVVYDLDRDGVDEAIMSLNQYDCDFTFSEDTLSPPSMQTQLIALDFNRNAVQVIEQKDRFRNIFSTPWIGDLESDGYLDIIYSQYFNHADIRKYQGMIVKRLGTHIRCRREPRWGAYMGSHGNGIY